MGAVIDRSHPRLAEGVEVLGEYAGSGYKKPHYLVRRGDGQIIQLSHLIHMVASELDGERTVEEVAERVSERMDRSVSAEQVESLIGGKLEPLGLVPSTDGKDVPVQRMTPLLRLRLRMKALPAPVVGRLAVPFKPLFLPPVVVIALVAWAALVLWLLVIHGLGDGLRQALYEPAVFLLVLGLMVVSAAFHEFGHAAACAYGGARPGIIGAGVYIAWPAFFTDVTDSYRLGRSGRLRTDLGGVYFNALFSLATFGVYAATGFEPLLLVITLQQVEMLHQLIPVVRLDGYYILADLTGVPDLFRRVRPILSSMIPWRPTDPAAAELKPWVRTAVSAWVLLVAPVLLFNLVALTVYLPRMMATSWDSAQLQFDQIRQAVDDLDVLPMLAGVVQTVALAIPIAGICLTLWSVGRRVVKKTSDRPAIRGAVLVAIAAVGLWALRPDGDYTPLEAGERLRLQDVAAAAVTGDATRPTQAAEPPEAPAVPAQSPSGTDRPADSPDRPDPATEGRGDPAPAPPADVPSPRAPAAPALPPPVDVTVPAVTLPEVTVPSVTVPSVTVPGVTVPGVTVPPPVSVPTVSVTLPAPTVPAPTVPDLP